MKKLHFEVFKHIKFVLSEWADWTHPDSGRAARSDQRVLKEMTPFPYRSGESQMTKAEFEALSDEEAFNLCMKGVINGEHNGNIAATDNWEIDSAPYQLEFLNTRGVYDTCKICDKNGCNSCLVPFNDTE